MKIKKVTVTVQQSTMHEDVVVMDVKVKCNHPVHDCNYRNSESPPTPSRYIALFHEDHFRSRFDVMIDQARDEIKKLMKGS